MGRIAAISHHASSSSSHRHVDPPVPHTTPQTDGKLDEALKELGVIDAAVQQWRESMGDGAKQSQTEAEPEVFEQVPRAEFRGVTWRLFLFFTLTACLLWLHRLSSPSRRPTCRKSAPSTTFSTPHRCHTAATTTRALPTPAHHPTHTPLQSDAIRRCAASALCWQAAQWQGVCL